MKIVLKYCGGCNPLYDRTAAVEKIKHKLKGRAEFIPVGTKDPDLILVVFGCPVACADLSPFKGLTHRTICSPEEAETLMGSLIIAPSNPGEAI